MERIILLIIFVLMSSLVFGQVTQKNADNGVFFQKVVKGKYLMVLPTIYDFESISSSDKGGRFGDLIVSAETAAGLASIATSNGKYDKLVWFKDWQSPDGHISKYYYDEILKITKMKPVETDPIYMIKELFQKGIIKGYILYKRDDTKRNAYDDYSIEDYGKHSSLNVATSLSPVLEGIAVESDSESLFKEMGMVCLADVRDKNEKWFFDNYKDKINRKIIFVIDPKVPDNRDFAVFSKGMVVYGNTDFEKNVYDSLEPNTPVVGWGPGDEYQSTSLFSKNAIYNTASNWYFNLPVHSTIRAGKDIPWSKLELNPKIDPFNLKWQENVHYTSYLLSDGDNVQWTVGNFINNESYWGNKGRGSVPYGWGLPVVCEHDLNPLTLMKISETKTLNDGIFTGGLNGYVYLDEYAENRPDRLKVLGEIMAKTGDVLAKYNVNTAYVFSAGDWKSKKSMEAYQVLVDNMPNMNGFFVVQYSPYNAGLGEIIWLKNKNGKPVPIISARFSMWKGLKQLKYNGSPAPVADWINKQPYEGAIVSDEFIDWTVIHAWSEFRKANTDVEGLWAEENKPKEGEKVEYGFSPTAWSINKLEDHVKVVKPDELTWYARLHLTTKDTLIYLANELLTNSKISKSNKEKVNQYLSWIEVANLETETEKKAAFEMLVNIKNGL